MITPIEIAWNENYENDGLLFFFQRIQEMLDFTTIDIFRAPLLNTHRLIDEYIRICQGSAKPYHLDEVYNEFINSFKSDVILQFKVGDEKIQQIIDRLNKYPQKREETMEFLLHSIFSKYLEWIKEYLEYIVPINKEKRKVEKAIRCFIPEILRCGYSRDEVYHSAKQFLLADVDPSTALSSFLKIYTNRKKAFSVYIGVSEKMRKFDDLLSSRLGVSFADDGNFSKCDTKPGYCVVMKAVKALDASAAANEVYTQIGLFTTFFQYFGNYSGNLIQNTVFVLSEDGTERKLVVNRGKYKSVEDDNPPMIGELSELIITHLVNGASCSLPQIRKITTLHNRAISNNGLENGFLNFWSILEMICVSNPDGSKIDQIISVAVPVLKRSYYQSLFLDLQKNIKRIFENEQYNSIIQSIEDGETEFEKIACLVLMPKYTDQLDSITDNLVNYPVIRTRMLNLHDDCTGRNVLLNTMNHYAQRVSWHLFRLYRARNMIVHSGKSPSDLKDLGEHLHAYVDCLTDEVIIKLATSSFCHVSNVLVNSELQQEVLEEYLKDSAPIDYDCIKRLFPQLDFWYQEASSKKRVSP